MNAQQVANDSQPSLRSKLDDTWSEISKEKVVDFLKRTVGPRTSISELLSVLSYDKVQSIKDQLGDIPLGEVMQSFTKPSTRQTQAQPVTRRRAPTRMRSSSDAIGQEMAAVLKVLKDNPGISRGDLAKRLRGQLGNKSLAHVSYLLRKLTEAGQIRQHGERKGATYEAA